ncbi:MAG: hypothetical protein JWL73_1128 [Actinomycetia bacterium]|nr:hypothetical protein [Actinomycetes bacterium]
MVELGFACVDIQPEQHAVGPTLLVTLRVTESSGTPIRAVALRSQVRVEPQRRRYSAEEGDRMVDLFGERAQWADSVHPMQLASLSHMVPGFTDSIDIVLPLPCTYDMEVATGKYFGSLDDGEIPLLFLFSGTVFVDGPKGFAVEPVPWHLEAAYRMPVDVWRRMIDLHFPDQGWIALRRSSIDALRAYAAAEVITSGDLAVERLLKEAGWPR